MIPFGTAVPFWGQTTQFSSRLSPKRDCGPESSIVPRPTTDFSKKRIASQWIVPWSEQVYTKMSCSEASLAFRRFWLNHFRTAVPFWGQTSCPQNGTYRPKKLRNRDIQKTFWQRDCPQNGTYRPKRVKEPRHSENILAELELNF